MPKVAKKRAPRIFDPDLRRERIVRGAIRAFARRNYQATTTAELAKVLKLSEAAIYKNFDSKRDLFVAVLEQIGRDFRLATASDDGESTAAEALSRMALGFLDYLSKNLDEAKVLYQAVSDSHDPVIRAKLREVFARHSADVERVIRRGQQEGLFRRDVDSGEVAWAFLNAEQAFVFSRILGFPYLTRRRSILGLLDVFFRGLSARQ